MRYDVRQFLAETEHKMTIIFKTICIQRSAGQYTFHVLDIGRSLSCEIGCTGRFFFSSIL
jgi:hypothetical protein